MKVSAPPEPLGPHLFANLGLGAKKCSLASRASQFLAPKPTQNPVATPGVFISRLYYSIDNIAAFSKNKTKIYTKHSRRG